MTWSLWRDSAREFFGAGQQGALGTEVDNAGPLWGLRVGFFGAGPQGPLGTEVDDTEPVEGLIGGDFRAKPKGPFGTVVTGA